MNFLKKSSILLALILLFSFVSLLGEMSRSAENFDSKALDINRSHNVGNAWLRVSNYGFFGSGNANPQWPSLEYPGGSGIDYLYQGALWFGAQRVRRDASNRIFYWKGDPNARTEAERPTSDTDMTTENRPDFEERFRNWVVIDTLVSVGFDGYWGIMEFLPAWNPLESQTSGYSENNRLDVIAEASIRFNRRAFDDDGDGFIDEDPVGRAFPFRKLRTLMDGDYVDLPKPYHEFAGMFIHEMDSRGTEIILANDGIWFPLGFQDLSYTADGTDGRLEKPIEIRYNLSHRWDDDNDLIIDEDGAPVSEQDYISYYYDYSPFSTVGSRSYGRDASRNRHSPLNVRVRQMSYQWSYDYIKNLTYVEFNITNMNPFDTLFNCVMGIYMDCDTGPQSWDSEQSSIHDVSGYVSGENLEFAYTRNYTYPTITPHWIGARVVNPDPEQLHYSAWTYSRMDKFGPHDHETLVYNYPSQVLGDGRRTSNEKYWLLSGRNPDTARFVPMKQYADESALGQWEEDKHTDTRFLFAFYGDMKGYPPLGEPGSTATDESWNLKPFDTMKIVVAIFPGENLNDLKRSARWAKTIYKDGQNMAEVILPDTLRHYEPPEPPDFPRLNSILREEPQGSNIINLDVYWSNHPEYWKDEFIVDRAIRGWQDDTDPKKMDLDSHISNWDPSWPAEFEPIPDGRWWNPHAEVNPYTAHRIQHSFQGYTLWSRSGRGDRDAWMRQHTYDKIETEQDHIDYRTNNANFAGDIGIDAGLPNRHRGNNGFLLEEDLLPGGAYHGFCEGHADCSNLVDGKCGGHVYTILSDDYFLRPMEIGDMVFGKPLYNMLTPKQAIEGFYNENNVFMKAIPPGAPPNIFTDEQRRYNQLLFKHRDVDEEIYMALMSDTMIPLPGHFGQNNVITEIENSGRLRRSSRSEEIGDEKLEARYMRLGQRYYHETIRNLPKGKEFYVAASSWSRGLPAEGLGALESGRDANMQYFFPGPLPSVEKRNIYVVPNPYRGASSFDGAVEGDPLGDRSRRIWFVGLPARANVQIYTLAGDLVDEFEHYPGKMHPVITISKEIYEAAGSGTIHPWDLLSRNNQIIASGLYFFSVKCHDTGDVQVGRFAVIR